MLSQGRLGLSNPTEYGPGFRERLGLGSDEAKSLAFSRERHSSETDPK
jgi:hypothetical protein